ncbi:MAG: anti-sigma factor [Vicinamibacterales bacterium]
MAPTTPTRGSSWLFRVTAAGCLVAAGGLGWYAAHQVNLARDLRLGLAEATARIELSERNAAMSRQVLEDARAQATILTAPDLSSVMLEAQPGARGAKGRAFWSPTRGVVLAVSNIPPISSDRVYQLWFVTPPNPVSAGLLRVDDAGRIFETIVVPEGSSPPVAIAVTIELKGGADSPTGEVLLLGRTDR